MGETLRNQDDKIPPINYGGVSMLKLFAKYFSVGVLNTAVHWLVFTACLYGFHIRQASANLIAFCVAVSLSYYLNARFTFRAPATTMRYVLFVGFMGLLSFTIGWIADFTALPPLLTLITFSAVSLICGFFYSKLVVFRDNK